ncbi:sugar ABC transporter permease [Thermocladium modestius]|uniref:Sugar ABC transporter permease n=1 Tax=Thermocladium modestius TaxID=62609 RepID=A0A830GTL8_9CREN|nr:ABC transporter permease [Thermocladium modestius]GGP20936.1 sugar ABC transporter permease [Thermocladium modestius]
MVERTDIRKKTSAFLKLHREVITAIIFALLIAIFYAINPLLMTLSSWASIMITASEYGIVSIFITLLLIGGEFDLSVGSVFVLGGMSFGILINSGYNPYLSLIISLAVSTVVGLANGLITVYLNVPSFITTLGTSYALEGLLLIVTGGFPISIVLKSVPFWTILSGNIFHGINAWTIWFIAITAISYMLLEHTRFGNHIFATGGSVRSAYAVGVNVKMVKMILFMLSALAAGFMGILSLTYFTSMSVDEGQTLPLLTLAVAVIGGTPLTGGIGKMQGTFLASLIIGLIYVGLVLAKVPSYWYITFVGIILIVVAVINQKAIGAKLIPT